ncbi:hypothetical protein CWC05_18300 [Pseudoalteromonas ruthenica]|uniref:Uncharacterized protein n=1 Tax=Pseudoalteromonas ruthenica TaxID=151081 RepID=A0A5S3YZN7_9GAMM|nr:DUF4325 domain-containing protein [Pseudoalteromonas ruthenica]TMP85493.1 hypothetical protein CWC05_18300 [Pseudoalteromonas ruthenica]
MSIEINLADASGRNYVGKPNGERFRALKKIDTLDQDGTEELILEFPANVDGITSSFFVGLFKPSMLVSGSEERFKERLKIVGDNEEIRRCVEHAIHHVFLTESINGIF